MSKWIQMRIKIQSVFILALTSLMISCLSDRSSRHFGLLSDKTINLVQKAVFEVIIEKPIDDQILYDRELNWESVPYAIRTDEYNSIGTAFAISNTELISAFHVFGINPSLTYMIRDSNGNIFEVDQIKGGCNERDFIIFTVKSKRFDDYFQFENIKKMGNPVFSVGNALGEGIIMRNGFILGTVPEDDSGRWNLLKSSAEGSPGNSGGPLITPDGKAIALVTFRKDNILYSIPADVILNHNRSFLFFRTKTKYSHLLLPDGNSKVFEAQIPLPVALSEATSIILEAHREHYAISMMEHFNNAPEYLTSTNNAHLLNSSFSSIFPQFSFIDSNDGNWKLSRMTNQNYDLGEDGTLMHISRLNFDFYKIIKPRSVLLETVNTDPKFIMDLILRNIRTERTLWGWSWDDNSDKYRILSYGSPSSTGQYRDTLGRNWITDHWNIAYSGMVLSMYILPLPNGSVLITKEGVSAFIHELEMDLQKICVHTFVAYEATFAEWMDFMEIKEHIPDFFNNFSFVWNNIEQRFAFSCGLITINSDKQTFNWTNNSRLSLFPFWYRNNNNLEFGIRRVELNQGLRGDDYFIIIRNIKPDSILGSIAMERWNDLVFRNHPFNERPGISISDNTGTMAAVIDTQGFDTETIFSLYFSMRNPINEDNLVQRFNAIKNGLSFLEHNK